MKKTLPVIVYLLGWIYPLCAAGYAVLDVFIVIRNEPDMFNFGQNWIVGYIIWALIFAIVTFLIYFVCGIVFCNVRGIFCVTLLNLPLYFVSLYSPFYSDSISWITFAALLSALVIVVFTVYVSLKKTQIKAK